MYISGLGNIDKPQQKKKPAKTGSSAFSELFAESKIEDAQTQPTASVQNTSSLFFLQEVGDEESSKKEAVIQGFNAIKHLENIRMGLLCGALTKDDIAGLENVLKKLSRNFTDPKLLHLIDEIELRAKVEIAKLTAAL